MKRKTTILIGLCTLGLMTWEAQAENPKTTSVDNIETSIPYGYEEIVLRGDLATSIGPNAIEAGANDNSVYIGFNQDFGNVNISIYNGMGGLVYSTVVNTSVQSVVIIPFTSAASGSYIVELNSADGYAEGDFDKD